MRYITTGERIGYERGKLEGEQALILRLLQNGWESCHHKSDRSSNWRQSERFF